MVSNLNFKRQLHNKVTTLIKITKLWLNVSDQHLQQGYAYCYLLEIQFNCTFIGIAVRFHNIFYIGRITAAHTYLDGNTIFMT